METVWRRAPLVTCSYIVVVVRTWYVSECGNYYWWWSIIATIFLVIENYLVLL